VEGEMSAVSKGDRVRHHGVLRNAEGMEPVAQSRRSVVEGVGHAA
jgi:hypothetical protein